MAAGTPTAPNSLFTDETPSASGKAGSSVPKLTDKKPTRRALPPPVEGPEDPFAPDEFNRRFHPRED
jgi:hypothetical protein